MKNCSFLNNKADKIGGALYKKVEYPITIINCTFENNEAPYGGTIYFDTTDRQTEKLTIDECKFNNNVALLEGSAIYLFKGNQASCEIFGNTELVNGQNEKNLIYLQMNKLIAHNTTFNIGD